MDGTNAYFYMNGEKYDEQPYMLGTGYDAMIHMGCAVNTDYAWRSQDVYNGALDDVRFYSRVLDEDEVLAIYEGEADISGINDKVAAQFELAQNYPNPFNSSTTIEYSLPGNSQTEIVVYDLLWHEVATLVDGYRNAGKYKVTWDASELSTGVYIYQLKTDDFIVSKKMKLIK